MKSLVLKSPAKVNLYLNVLRKRPDGYHEIETVFEKIALFDIITITPRPKGIKVTASSPKLPTGKTNLVYKAAKLIFDKTGFKGGVCVDIDKNIPIAAGLGGGSSDAATTLIGLNRIFKLGLRRSDMLKLARELGADVAFFMYDCSFAIGKGRGDEIRPVRGGIVLWHNIISFDFGVSAGDAYRGLNLGLTPGRFDVKMPLRFPSLSKGKKDVEILAVSLYNKLEEVVLGRYGILRLTKSLLIQEGSCGALLSGSGPTIFGITKTREEAIAVRSGVERLLGDKCRVFTVKTFSG